MQSMGIFQKAMFYPQTRTRSALSVIIFLMLLSVGLPANAQVIDRSIDEIKHESIDRVKRGAYPLGGLNLSDV